MYSVFENKLAFCRDHALLRVSLPIFEKWKIKIIELKTIGYFFAIIVIFKIQFIYK